MKQFYVGKNDEGKERVPEEDFKHDIVLAPTWVKTILQR